MLNLLRMLCKKKVSQVYETKHVLFYVLLAFRELVWWMKEDLSSPTLGCVLAAFFS